MKINKVNVNNLYPNTNKPKEDKPKNIDTKVVKSANVEISSSAKRLANEIEGSKDANFSDRVEKIRQSILDGSYKVSSEAIADKILQVIEKQKGSEI